AFPGIQMDGNLVLTDIGVSGGNTITFRVRNSILPEYIWDGSTSNDWTNASNWSRDEIPTTTSNVVIPYGVPNYPRSGSTRAINDLHVEPGATITLGAGTLQVRGNFENQGNLAMNHTDAALVVEGDMFFRSGSVTSITNAGALMVFHGNLNFDAGSNVDMVLGTVQFNDTGNSYIVVNAPTQIGELIAQVTAPSYLYVISDNGSKLTINGQLYIWANCHMSITSEMTVGITGEFKNMSGYFTCTAGTVIMEGNTSTTIDNSVVSTNYFHDLKIAKSGGATVTLTSAVEIMGRLRIEPGASLLNDGKSMIIHEDLLSYGFLNLTGTDDIYVYNDILWGIGATASIASNNITIQVAGDMTFLPGSNIDLDYGIFYFYANGTSTIGVYENATVSVIGCFKSDPYYLAIDGDATRALNIGMGIQVDAGNILKVTGPANIHMTGFLTINGLLQCNDGAFIFDGNTDSNLTCSSTAGNYFHDLTIDKQNNHKLNLLADLMIKGNLLITAGILQTNNYTIESKGNWTNNVGEPGFLFGTSQVIFSGTGNQYCYGEHFYTMVLNKTGGELIFPGSSFSRCMYYDWTAGSIRVDGGYFVADDLVDPGIYGNFILNSGNIDLFQDAASLIDLNASLTIHGGNFSIYGGSAASRWANGVNAGITMDGGVLDFIDNGILNRITSYTMTLNLTGGKIRTNRNLSITRSSTVIPTGTFELYGSTDATVTFGSGTGISIPNLIIDKGTKMLADIDNEHDPISVARNSSDEIQRTSVASANSNLIINGYLSVVSGTFSVNGKTIQVGSSVSVNGTLQMTSVGGAYGSITCGGDFIWNNGSVSNITGGTIQYGESWKFNSGSNVVLTSCPVTFTGSSNAFITSSSTTANFGNLILNGSRVSGDPVWNYMSTESTQPLVILGTLVINNDNYLYLSGKTLSTNDNITLTGDALLALDANAVLKLASAKTLTVNSGAALQVLGCYGHPATITHQTGYYVVNIESGANISARYGVFEYMGTSGINVKSGAIVNTTNTFNYCTFQNGAASGSLLTMNSTQTLTSYGAIFPTNTWSGSYNVSKSTTGTITFINATGGFSGESYDGDPMFRVFWTSDTYELTHLWDGADHSNLYVCDPVIYNIAIYNPSVSNILTPFRVDIYRRRYSSERIRSNILTPFRVDIYHNRTSAPAVGEEGDQYIVVNSLNASSSIELFFPATSSTTAGTWQTWFQIDTFNEIAESNETNNIFSSVTTTWNSMPEVTTPTIFYDTQLNLLQLNWTYPISVHNYVIYRSDNPNGPFTQVGTAISPSYSETLTNNKYFYRITAVKIWQ
ncbi:MAG TPA: CARDB domain-containing protein, partial [Candidatus Cloacimonadota bacterium]|nr:CARDB domain-containing protein [Candidatus Cloacimonadota bacterium]